MEYCSPVDNAALFVEISNAMSNLKDDVSRKVFTKIREFDNLVE